MRIQMLGVPIDVVTRVEARMKAEQMLGGAALGRSSAEQKASCGHMVTTPNPEMLVLAHQDPGFRTALGRADLAIPDGFGLLLVARALGTPLPERVTGTDFVLDLADMTNQKGLSVYLLGGVGDVASRAADALRRQFPGLHVAGAESGGTVNLQPDGRWQMDSSLLDRIRLAAPDLLLVAFGHGKQERWIASHLDQLPSVRLAIGIGGAFDFLAGRVRRAPTLLRRIGLEWLWRLALEPRRLGRIWTAVIVFPWLALRAKR